MTNHLHHYGEAIARRGEAMARLHSVHDPLTVDPNWRACRTSALRGGASRLLDDCELEMAAARMARGEVES